MRLLAATCTALALAFAAGCGGDEEGEPIPADDAQAMLEQLDGIESQVDAGACQGARAQIVNDGELQDKVAALPTDVDADVRSALEDSLDRLLTLIEDQCGQDEEQDTDTTETEAPPTDTGETETQETQTQETQPPDTQETQPPDTQETQPPPTTDEQQPLPGDDGGAPAPGAGNGGGAGGTG